MPNFAVSEVAASDAAATSGDLLCDLPGVLCDVQAMVADTATMSAGVLWRLTDTARQLDANLVHLPAGQHIGPHGESKLDVLLVVVAGSGTLHSDGGPLPLSAGVLVWLPRGAARNLVAGADGLAYLTVHERHPGGTIDRPRPALASLPNESATTHRDRYLGPWGGKHKAEAPRRRRRSSRKRCSRPRRTTARARRTD